MLVVDYLFISLFTCSVDHLSASRGYSANCPPRSPAPHRSTSLPLRPLIVHFCDVVHHHGTSFSTASRSLLSSLSRLFSSLLLKNLHTERYDTKLIAASRPRPHGPPTDRQRTDTNGGDVVRAADTLTTAASSPRALVVITVHNVHNNER